MLPLILDFGTRRIGMVNCRPRPLYFLENIAVPIGGTERRSAAISRTENVLL